MSTSHLTIEQMCRHKEIRKRLVEITNRLSEISLKIDIGRFKYSEKQERDRLVEEYLHLDKELENIELVGDIRANKIKAIIARMERHENLNKEDFPFVVEILKKELGMMPISEVHK